MIFKYHRANKNKRPQGVIMPKYNHLRSLVNQSSIDRRPRKTFKRKTQHGDVWSFEINVDPSDQALLKRYALNELELYNHLMDGMLPTSFRSPETFLAMSHEHVALFGQLTEQGVDITNISSFYGDLFKFQHLLERNVITSEMKSILSCARSPGSIINLMRRAMAKEMLRYFIMQAKTKSGLKIKSNDTSLYRTSISTIGPQTSITKRHVQIAKDSCKIEWDDNEGQTLIHIPYTRTPIKLREVNLVGKEPVYNTNGELLVPEEPPFCSWNLLLIHQLPGRIPDSKTPWVIELYSTQYEYLVDYIEQKNPMAGSSFRAMSRRGN